MDAPRNPTGKEQAVMKNFHCKTGNIKYRHKLTILLVIASFVPIITDDKEMSYYVNYEPYTDVIDPFF